MQEELLEKAKQKNIIVYLGTGSGKTFIAAMLMKHMKDKLLGGLQKVEMVSKKWIWYESEGRFPGEQRGLVGPAGHCVSSNHWSSHLKVVSDLLH